MLPGMPAKPRITIIGAGNLGMALALSLKRSGYEVEAIVSRRKQKSPAKAEKVAAQVGADVVFHLNALKSEVIWFCVPDAEIAAAAASLAPGFDGVGRVVLHSSGALASDELEPMRHTGASAASVHPLMTFVRGSTPSLAGVSFALEGDRKAVRVARRIVLDLAGQAYAIKKSEKAAYHAWGAFTSPLFTALLATSEQVAVLAGISPKNARRRAIPILLQTLANYASFGAAGAFSGPIVRGDVETMEKHLEALRGSTAARDAYCALAQAALQFLPAKNKAALKNVLKRSGGKGRRR